MPSFSRTDVERADGGESEIVILGDAMSSVITVNNRRYCLVDYFIFRLLAVKVLLLSIYLSLLSPSPSHTRTQLLFLLRSKHSVWRMLHLRGTKRQLFLA